MTAEETKEIALVIGTIAKVEGLRAIGLTVHLRDDGSCFADWYAHGRHLCALAETCEDAIALLRSKEGNQIPHLEYQAADLEERAAVLRTRIATIQSGKECAA